MANYSCLSYRAVLKEKTLLNSFPSKPDLITPVQNCQSSDLLYQQPVGGGGGGTLVSTATQSTNCLSSKHEEAVALLTIPGGAGVVPPCAEKCSLGKASSNAHLIDLIRYAPLLKIIDNEIQNNIHLTSDIKEKKKCKQEPKWPVFFCNLQKKFTQTM